nr:hypothetical protein Cplu_106 [Cedratvirus plubellavi]
MLQVYSTILSFHEEPKDMYQVCSLFMSVLSDKSFWKERHQREGLPFVEHNSSHLRTYYLTREFVGKEVVLSCHLSELPFFPSFAQGEEYYPRAIKFRKEKIPESINRMILHRCVYFYSSNRILANYISKKASIDRMITSSEKALDVKDHKHPSLDVSVRLYRTEFTNYCFYLYIDLDDEEGGRVEVPVENTLVDIEEALSFYLQVVKD